MLNKITPLILTYNEEPNIARCLEKLSWAKRIVVVDSFSTDRTLEILKNYPQVTVVQRGFDTHAAQWNFGLEQIGSGWVLSLDADYVLSEDVLREIGCLDGEMDGYFARFLYCVSGEPLKDALLPPRMVLFQKGKGVYIDDGHTQRLKLSGPTKILESCIFHDDRKPFSRWFQNQKKYAGLEAEKLLRSRFWELNFHDRIRWFVFFAPGLIILYCLFYKRLIWEGG